MTHSDPLTLADVRAWIEYRCWLWRETTVAAPGMIAWFQQDAVHQELAEVLAMLDRAPDTHNKEQVMRLDHLVRSNEQAIESDDDILPPDAAGTLFVPPDDRVLGSLRHRLNNAIRITEPGKSALLDVGHIRSNLARRLAAECQHAGWSAEILPVDSVAQDHPLQTGSILKLTKPEVITGGGASP